GFMVFNHATYPNLTRLFRELGVETKQTEMSFSVQHTPSGLEYGGGNLNVLFGQRRNLFSPRHWKMLMQMDRFNKEAIAALNEPRWAGHNLRDYVAERGYGDDFLNLFIVPMGSAVWSTPPELMLDFPALTLIRFWHNHGFLGLDTQHQWWTVCNGAKSYVKKITAPFSDRVQLGRKVVRVSRENEQVQIHTGDGATLAFDKVIFACHGDQILPLLDSATELETRLLGAFKYQPNTATLHTDDSFMPRTRRVWSSWNYRLDSTPGGDILPTTHYWMNQLQGVSDRKNYFVSLNCEPRINPQKILKRIAYEHPLFNLAAIAAQKELPELNRLSPDQTTYYAGAWFKYGFHEDGFTSGLECAMAVTGENLWA
ncbi:MAG: FAD-dependent oxidoreductase, partial [Gloeobacteraceae cyanobacterium ES-bin-144]|nr:FAD-dependent oxidoreductase [Verrucomicrobiales bacterium]